jgi:hypothetical protein
MSRTSSSLGFSSVVYIYTHIQTHTHTHYTMPHMRIIREEATQLHFEKRYVRFTYT